MRVAADGSDSIARMPDQEQRIINLERQVKEITDKHNALARDFAEMVRALREDRKPSTPIARY